MSWEGWNQHTPGKCVNANAVAWANGGINIIIDIIVLILPIPRLLKLLLPWKRRFQIILLLSLGGLVVVIGVLRLTSLIKFGSTDNITWDYVAISYWSTLEVNIAILCACLPAIPPLFRRQPGERGESIEAARRNQSHHRPQTSDAHPLLRLKSVHVRGRPGNVM